LQTTNRECDHTIELYTTEETIETTAEHPFYTTNGWKDAADLQSGDKIITQNDESIEIIETKFNYEPKQVYNFEVADWHTYFVGNFAWQVHNGKGKCVTDIVKKKLLPGEGKVGTYKKLSKAGKKGDNLTPHHIPSDGFMKGKKVKGYKRDDGISINMEQPKTGGRHRQTSTYGRKPDLTLNPRDALAKDIKNARRIYQKDGLYTPQVRKSLQDVVKQNKNKWKPTFDKPPKK
jgi:intein/homing endonuclease